MNSSRLKLGGIIGLFTAVLLVVLIHLSERNRQLGAQEQAQAATLAPVEETAGAPEESQRPNEGRILAGCHPHLNGNPSVPSFDMGGRPSAVAANLKARFWVNGDGFVTQAFLTGARVVNASDQEEALHYVKGLTFSVPNTPECQARQIELIGTFLASHSASGEWATVFEVHPRFTLAGDRVVQNR